MEDCLAGPSKLLAVALDSQLPLLFSELPSLRREMIAIDLFAGAGGLSLGFEAAGFSVPLAVEIDDWAADTYLLNRKATNLLREDVANLPDATFKEFQGADVVMGGPPCQGFSISASNRRKPDDPRNFLYKHFLRAIRVIDPSVVLMENVKGILRAKTPDGVLILEDIMRALQIQGYKCAHGVLKATEYGVPQDRHRFFLVAAKEDPHYVLRPGPFRGGLELFEQSLPVRTLWDAISDLPVTDICPASEDAAVAYKCEPRNEYQMLLRGGLDTVFNHVPMRHTGRILERFRKIPIGAGCDHLPTEHLARRRGSPETLSGIVYGQNHRRPFPDRPSPTITASFYSSFVHPYADRNFTVREAARIQSFPDSYRFLGKRTTLSHKLLARKGILEDIHLDQFSQVGNAVPPLLAEHLARRIADLLGGKVAS